MSNGGKRLNELIKERGRTMEWVAKQIDVNPNTIGRWKDTAPIVKLVKLSRCTGIPLRDVLNSLLSEEDRLTQTELEDN